jgi:hypothetical protein
MKLNSISFSSSAMPGATAIIVRVYGSLPGGTTGKLIACGRLLAYL